MFRCSLFLCAILLLAAAQNDTSIAEEVTIAEPSADEGINPLILSMGINQDQECGANEYFASCGNACEPQCGDDEKGCAEECQLGACHCETGYYRSSFGRCVLPYLCE
ncbi:unnamed protein product, partial [Mesorhabditis spiculigera]